MPHETLLAQHEYVIGARVAIEADIRVAAAYTDPTTVRFKVRTPAGVVTTYEYPTATQIVKEAVGMYRLEFTVTAAGTWWVRLEVLGVAEGAQEIPLIVTASMVGA